MSTTEDVARLKLEGDDSDFSGAIARANAQIEQLQNELRAGAITFDEFEKQTEEVTQALELMRAAQAESTAAAAKQTAAMVKAAAASAEGTARTQAAARGLVDLSRGLEDFSTGGFLGILNNIPGMFTNMGRAIGVTGAALGGLTAGVSLLATGSYVLYRNWDKVRALFEESHAIPRAKDDIEAWKDELKKANKELDDLKDKTSLSNSELARFNELSEKAAQLEHKLTEEKKKRHELEQAMSAKSKEQRERGTAFTEAANGEQARIRKDILAAYQKESENEIAEFKRRMDDRLQNLLKSGATNAEMEKAAAEETRAFESFKKTQRAGLNDLADQLVVDLHNGAAGAVEKLNRLRNTGVQIGPAGFMKKFEEATPEAKKIDEEHDKLAHEFEAEMAKAATAQKKIVKAALEPMLKAGDLKGRVANAMKVAETEFAGSSKEERYAIVKGIVEDELKRRLGKKGVKFDASKDLLSSAATQLLTGGAAENKAADAKAKSDAAKAKTQAQNEAKKRGAATEKTAKEIEERAKGMDMFQARGEAFLAQMIASGRARMGANGKLSDKSRDQLANAIHAELKQAMPGMGTFEAAVMGRTLTANIEKGVGQKLLGQVGSGLNAQMATQEVVLETQQAVQALANKLAVVEARNRQLGRHAAGLQRQAAMPGPTNLTGGGPT